MSKEYVPPGKWVWEKGNGGKFANINRPVSGKTHEKNYLLGVMIFNCTLSRLLMV